MHQNLILPINLKSIYQIGIDYTTNRLHSLPYPQSYQPIISTLANQHISTFTM